MDARFSRSCAGRLRLTGGAAFTTYYYDPGHGVQQHYGLRAERYTLAYFHPVNEWELFDLRQDPLQMMTMDVPEVVRLR
jgi:hypothetical protein